MFTPTVGLVELIVRTVIIFTAILAGLRLFRRDAGEFSKADLLVVVLIADAAQNALSAEYRSITEGLVIIATIFGLEYLLNWLAYRFPWARRILQPKPLLLIRDGRVLAKNLRSEMLTLDDLNAQLRLQGVDDVALVRQCYLEEDGRISVLRSSGAGSAGPPPSRPE